MLAIFRGAGQGLAAAHAAQLVHRDFKPSNVLLGKDGRVQVTDFGLAKLVVPGEEAETRESPVPLASEAPVAILQLYEQVTLPGIIMGTPHYMAPEQYRGDAPDARSDQFSSCASLYYALYGQRPFKPARMMEVLKKSRPRASGVHQQTLSLPPPKPRKPFWKRSREDAEHPELVILEPPRERRVPGWLRQAVMRGSRSIPSSASPPWRNCSRTCPERGRGRPISTTAARSCASSSPGPSRSRSPRSPPAPRRPRSGGSARGGGSGFNSRRLHLLQA